MEIKLPDISCTGCEACLHACKFGAINMVTSEDGFLYPAIDADKCVKCGQCINVCHAIGNSELMRKPSKYYAAQIKDKKTLHSSSSGGLFSALAKHILNCNGIVYGCIYDEDYNAKIVRAETLDQVKAMCGSKYVWSNSGKSYPKVKHDLEDGYEVLYTCLPCQAAGLRKYLKKEYSNLYVVDLLCGGAPSPYAFQKYLETITDHIGREKLDFQFRDKERFGAGVDCTYVQNGKKHYESWLENSFYFAFSSKARITWRQSCYGCNYKSINRVSDITIGDYWGVEKYHDTFNPKEGVSVVLINTEAGTRIFDTIKDSIEYEKSNVQYVIERNSLVMESKESHHSVPTERDAFFRTLHTHGWIEADKRFLGLRKTMLFKGKITKVRNKIRRLFN